MVLCSRIAAFSIPSRFAILLSLAILTGCQAPQPGLGDRMANHMANIDFSGLSADYQIPELNARVAIPHGWQPMSMDVSPIYVHQQWRSPAHNTGVGVAFIHMPLPLSAKALVWLARTEYSKQSAADHTPDAQMLGEWTDSLGREWFEGENARYHVKGYVVTDGMDAWAVYSGYRLRNKPRMKDLSLAYRSMESIVPMPLTPDLAQR